MLRAITHKVSPRIGECELTFVERTPIDYDLATRQHDEYEATLSTLGVEVTSLTGNAAYPDSCFVEDTAIVCDRLAVICSMGVESRRREPLLIARELEKYLELAWVSLPATIEGGDILLTGRRVLAGCSRRTNFEGIRELQRIVSAAGFDVLPLQTTGSLHLKSACTALDDETLLVNPDWIHMELLKDFRLIRTPPEEPGAANVLRVGKAICVQAKFPRTVELVQRVVDQVEVVDMSELRKAEAGLTCSSIIFESEI
jgi:dimethylargininase